MAKIKSFLRNLSFRMSFVLYVVVFIVIAFFLISITMTICQNSIAKIHNEYNDAGEWYYLVSADGERLNEKTWISKSEIEFSNEDNRNLSILNAVSYICIPVYSLMCLVLATALFYRNKMKRPLAILQEAHEKISNNDLDFEIEYENKDEMGNLCVSFEKMRVAMLTNNKKMWRQMEERKRLNAAFAHDLRTPLTVLKGHSEILEYEGEKQSTIDTAITMTRHIKRMERYVESMSNLQKLEDIVPDYKSIYLPDLVQSIKTTATFLCDNAGKHIVFHSQEETASAELDDEMILTVVENIIANATRYASDEVRIDIEKKDAVLTISVKDNGNGFSPESISRAAEPYYTTDEDRANHFGLGLYICKTLCRHHGGDIRLGNAEQGAFVSVSFKENMLKK